MVSNGRTPIAEKSLTLLIFFNLFDPSGMSIKLFAIEAPMVGTFYRSANPGSKAFVEVGDEIKEGAPICIKLVRAAPLRR